MGVGGGGWPFFSAVPFYTESKGNSVGINFWVFQEQINVENKYFPQTGSAVYYIVTVQF